MSKKSVQIKPINFNADYLITTLKIYEMIETKEFRKRNLLLKFEMRKAKKEGKNKVAFFVGNVMYFE
jgi:hypothetical protein